MKLKRKTYGSVLMGFGLLLMIVSLATATSLAVVNLGLFDDCESTAGWHGVFGSVSLNSADKTEGSNSVMLTVTSGSWGMSIYKDGSWDFSSAPVLTFDIKVSWLGSGVVFGIWTGDGVEHYVTDTDLATMDVGSWKQCYVDLRTAGVSISNVARIEWDFNNYMMQIPDGTTLQLDNIQATSGGTSPTPTPSTSPTPTATPTPSTSPQATPTPEPTATPSQQTSPLPSNDNFNRIGVLGGFSMFATGAVVTFTGRKLK